MQNQGQFTWIHEERRGDKSFFKLCRMMPYIFSTYAASCCLKSKAEYLASTSCISLPILRLAEKAMNGNSEKISGHLHKQDIK
jgi:hypothetical protein